MKFRVYSSIVLDDCKDEENALAYFDNLVENDHFAEYTYRIEKIEQEV